MKVQLPFYCMKYKTPYQQWKEYEAAGGDLSFFQWQQAGKINNDLLPPPGSMLKDSFWAEIEARWPGEFKRFTAWVDEYKNKTGWEDLFAGKVDRPEFVGFTGAKYHDLPAAMQIGIFLQYCIEENHRYEFLEGQPKSMGKLVDLIKEWFCEEEEAGQQDHQRGKYMDDFDQSSE